MARGQRSSQVSARLSQELRRRCSLKMVFEQLQERTPSKHAPSNVRESHAHTHTLFLKTHALGKCYTFCVQGACRESTMPRCSVVTKSLFERRFPWASTRIMYHIGCESARATWMRSADVSQSGSPTGCSGPIVAPDAKYSVTCWTRTLPIPSTLRGLGARGGVELAEGARGGGVSMVHNPKHGENTRRSTQLRSHTHRKVSHVYMQWEEFR